MVSETFSETDFPQLSNLRHLFQLFVINAQELTTLNCTTFQKFGLSKIFLYVDKTVMHCFRIV